MALIDDLNISVKHKIIYLNLYTQNEQGSITGTVKETGLPENSEVGLYDRKTRQLIALTRSVGGVYSFIGIDKNREYYVHAIDDHRLYNAVTQDMLMGNYDGMKAKGQI